MKEGARSSRGQVTPLAWILRLPGPWRQSPMTGIFPQPTLVLAPEPYLLLSGQPLPLPEAQVEAVSSRGFSSVWPHGLFHLELRVQELGFGQEAQPWEWGRQTPSLSFFSSLFFF